MARTLLPTLAAIVCLSAVFDAQEPPPLWDAQTTVTRLLQTGATRARAMVDVHFDRVRAASAGGRVRLPLPGGDEVVASIDFSESRADHTFVAGTVESRVGSVGGERGEMSLTLVGEALAGRIVTRGRVFALRKAAVGGLHVIEDVTSSFAPEAEPLAADPAFALPLAAALLGGGEADPSGYVDLLVVYTTAARSAAGGSAQMIAEIAGGVDNANLALAQAGAGYRFRLAHSEEVSYPEGAGETLSDLNRLTNTSDGILDTVHTLRDQYNADVVTLLTNNSDACGVAWVMGPSDIGTAFAPFAFNVVTWSCANANLSLAHEIGHNQGAQHDRDNAGGGSPALSYAFGFRVPGVARDVMSYACELQGRTSCPRRAIFSTPLAAFPGTTTAAGTATEDNARAFDITMPVVSGFRSADTTPAAPAITMAPSPRAIAEGQSTTFTVLASGTPPPTLQWLSTRDGIAYATLAASSTYSGFTSATLTVSAAPAALHGTFFRVVATNSVGSVATSPVGLTVFGPGTSSPSSLRFGATKDGASGALTAQTGTQTVSLSFTGAASAWTASADQSWLRVTGGSGSGNGRFTVALVNPDNVIGGSASLSAAITITASTAPNTPITMPVTLTVDQTNTATAAPYGAFDTPADGATALSGAIAVTGWALDDVAVNRVEIYRNCLDPIDRARGACQSPAPGVPANFVFIGMAHFVAGARPDVEALYATHPQAYRAGWGSLLLSNGFPNQTTSATSGGQGAFVLTAFAVDEEQHKTALGNKTITLDNDNATTPFGAIDTPDQGGNIPGDASPFNNANAYPNFGWAVTQSPKCLDANSTAGYIVGIDGVNRTLVAGVNWFAGLNRTDIASSFPGRCNSNNSGAAYYIDANALGLTAGLHTIGWAVTDSAGKAAGIGSRFFNIVSPSLVVGGADVEPPSAASLAGRPVALRSLAAQAGADDASPFGRVANAAVRIPSTERIVVDLGGPVEAGYQLINGQARTLPIGSTLDAKNGRFYWQPGVGFLGTFDLVFTTSDGGRVPVAVTLVDPSLLTGRGLEMVIDTPVQNAEISGGLRIAGWALDPRAISGSGIDTIHVWAYPITNEAMGQLGNGAIKSDPIFLGVATLGGLRPDVQRIYGVQFNATGYELPTGSLAPGIYDIVVYAWSARTNGWEDARVVRVVVR